MNKSYSASIFHKHRSEWAASTSDISRS